jgi:hypothetical protein
MYVEPFSDDSLKYIFANVLEWMFASSGKFFYDEEIKGMKANIVDYTIATYQTTVE